MRAAAIHWFPGDARPRRSLSRTPPCHIAEIDDQNAISPHLQDAIRHAWRVGHSKNLVLSPDALRQRLEDSGTRALWNRRADRAVTAATLGLEYEVKLIGSARALESPPVVLTRSAIVGDFRREIATVGEIGAVQEPEALEDRTAGLAGEGPLDAEGRCAAEPTGGEDPVDDIGGRAWRRGI